MTDPKNKRTEPSQLIVSFSGLGAEPIEYKFRKEFKIGRDENCEIQISKPGISRQHARVFLKEGSWWYKDLNSANGSFSSGIKIDEIPLGKNTRVELGLKNAILIFNDTGYSPEGQTIKEEPESVTSYVKHYFSDDENRPAGRHTRMIRGAFKKIQKKERKRYLWIISAVALIAITIGIYSYFQHQKIEQQTLLAQQIFYTMKTLELEISRLQDLAVQNEDSSALAEIRKYREEAAKLSQDYNRFLEELHYFDDSKWGEREKTIIHVARMFGECELGMPDDFLDEVKWYINEWRKTNRLKNAIQRSVENQYPAFVGKAMLDNGLPPQFFYLGLQESDYKVNTIGPSTRFGIAKGIWQFIPSTAKRYGLQTGPLVGLRRFDAKDERFDFKKSTVSAAKYLSDIYKTEAQASGLLVIASYNWGERRVRDLVRTLPGNPRERNFWQLLKKYRDELPRETYNYVFYIISAAAIGENPALFGFNFQNPLSDF